MKECDRDLLVRVIKDDYDDTTALLEDLMDEHAEVFEEKRRLEAELQRLHQLARYAAGSKPCPIHKVRHTGTSTTANIALEALMRIEKPASVDQVTKVMRDLDWETTSKNPTAVVRASLHRMEKSGTVTRTTSGDYTLPATSSA